MRTLALALVLAPAISLAEGPAPQQAAPPPAAAPAAAPAGPDLKALLAKADDAYKKRDQPGKMEECGNALAEAEKAAPNDYEVLWRLAQFWFWKSDDFIPDEKKSEFGKTAWDYGEKAIAANPKRVEGHYFAAIGIGSYSLGVGILKALTKGLEGKFKSRLGKALELDRPFDNAGVDNAFGRFYFELPWPKYDAEKSEEHLKKAIQLQPKNLRARWYLAETYLKEKKAKEAKALLDEVLAATPNGYDPAEEKRSQEGARRLLPKVQEALK